jgi:hypothetical protein
MQERSKGPPGGDVRCPASRALPNDAGAAIDFVDFVYLFDQTYLRDYTRSAAWSPGVELGPVIDHVTCTVSDLVADNHHEISGPFRDGNAAVLPVGTIIYSVHGYPPNCRVAVVQDSETIEFLAQRTSNHHSVPRGCALRRR